MPSLAPRLPVTEQQLDEQRGQLSRCLLDGLPAARRRSVSAHELAHPVQARLGDAEQLPSYARVLRFARPSQALQHSDQWVSG